MRKRRRRLASRERQNLLEWIVKERGRGKPKAIRTDNNPEFTSFVFKNWCHKHRIEIRYIQPEKAVQNAFIERFNRSVIGRRFWMQEL